MNDNDHQLKKLGYSSVVLVFIVVLRYLLVMQVTKFLTSCYAFFNWFLSHIVYGCDSYIKYAIGKLKFVVEMRRIGWEERRIHG